MTMEAAELLRQLTGKKTVYLMERGNKAILASLKIAKSLGKKKVVVQDQGGWITYLQFPERLKMQLVKMKTDFGIVIPNELSRNLDGDSVLLINSLTGYFAEQPMGLVSAIAKQKNAMLINDASGSIGTENAKYGDIILGSFGESKPIDLEYGGFMAFNEQYEISVDDFAFDKDKRAALAAKLEHINKRLKFLKLHHDRILQDLSGMDIIHAGKNGINVVIGFKDSFEKERIINYCEEKKYEYAECPRYMRVNANAISIEVKRLRGGWK